MKWLTNTYDPTRPDWESHVGLDDRAKLRQYLADKTIGSPKATEVYSSAQLAQKGMVGVYAREDETREESQAMAEDDAAPVNPDQ